MGRAITTVFVLLATITHAYGFKIQFNDQTGLEGVQVSFFDEELNESSPLVQSGSTWTFEQKSIDDWASEASFVVNIPGRAPGGGLLVGHPPLEYRISFSIPADMNDRTFQIPLVAFSSVTDKFIEQTELLPPRRAIEKMGLAAQLIQFWHGDLDSRRGERVLKLWFDATYQAFQTNRPVRFDADMLQFINNSRTNKEYYQAMLKYWRSNFWTLKGSRFDSLLQDGKCREARLLMDYVSAQHMADSNLALARAQDVKNPDEELAAMGLKVAGCKSSNPGQEPLPTL